MAAVFTSRPVLLLMGLALPALPALAGGWRSAAGIGPDRAGFRSPGGEVARFGDGALLVDEAEGERDGWTAVGARCVLRTVFDPIDGVEHAGTGAWLEVEVGLDVARPARGPALSAWGARLADWHHEASFWLLRDGEREGVVLASGRSRTELLQLPVVAAHRYRLTADETGAHLQVDGRTLLSLPLSRRAWPGEPVASFGAGDGEVRARVFSAEHGCLRPIGARLAAGPLPGTVRVALLGHEGFRPALEVAPGSLRVGDAAPSPALVFEGDADGDGHLDLVAILRLDAAPGSVLLVDARTDAGELLRGWDLAPAAPSGRP